MVKKSKKRKKLFLTPRTVSPIAVRILIIAAILIRTFITFGSNASSGVITLNGAQLQLDGAPYTFTGINAYGLATWWNVNWGCGGQYSDGDLDAFFAQMRPNSLVRFWAYQDLAINKNTNSRDWTGLDRVFAAAGRHNQRLIAVIGDEWGSCDGGAKKTDAWYTGGYNSPYSPDGYGSRVSYASYLHEVVARYKDSPALGMWELINEPEMTCGHASDLKAFFDVMGSQLKQVDPTHLLESGTIGGNQCSVVGADFTTIHSSSAIDVTSYHDYGQDNVPLPSGSSMLNARIAQSQALHKPLIVGEAGIYGNNAVAGCNTLTQRATLFQAKLQAQFAAGISGFMVWSFAPNTSTCTYDVLLGDPLLALLHDFTLPTSASRSTGTSSPAPAPAPAPVPEPNGATGSHLPTGTIPSPASTVPVSGSGSPQGLQKSNSARPNWTSGLIIVLAVFAISSILWGLRRMKQGK